ncbi:MAG: hypothetical protein ACXADL_12715, partial [Candidatus Thorarchaeota archaeon]
MGFGWSFKDNDWNRLRQIIQKIGSIDLGPQSTPTFAGVTITGDATFENDVTVGGDLTLSSLTEGSIPYIGASGVVSEDNAKLFWDTTRSLIKLTDSSVFFANGTSDTSSSELEMIIFKGGVGAPQDHFIAYDNTLTTLLISSSSGITLNGGVDVYGGVNLQNGTLTLTALTVNNGVLYNVSDVVTANANLTFNGSFLTVGTTLFMLSGSIFDTGGSISFSSNNLTTTGDIILPSLNPNEGIYTDGSSALTNTIPTSGTLGYWSRSGSQLTPANTGDDLLMTDYIYCGTKGRGLKFWNGTDFNSSLQLGSTTNTIGTTLSNFIISNSTGGGPTDVSGKLLFMTSLT